MNLEEYYTSRKALVDKAVKEFLEKEGLVDVSMTPLGGKRLRGVLTLLVAEALGGKPDDALDAAVAIELAHAASLDADDIVDLDAMRRGKPATWVLKGVMRTTIGTHALVASALELIRKYGYDAVAIFTTTYKKMVTGEIADLKNASLYENIIANKTASLWAAAGGLGAIAAGKKDHIAIAQDYGLATGMAFQIADDIVDTIKLVENGELMKLRQPTVLAFLGYLGLETMLRNPIALLKKGVEGIKNDVRDIAMNKLNQWIEAAQKHAHKFPDSEVKDILVDYPTLSVDLMFKEAGWK